MTDPYTEATGRRVLVFGGRDFHDGAAMERALRRHLRPGDVVIHGGARGADALAGDIAGRVLGHKVEVHPADWHHHGKAAGPIRNQEMLDSGIDYAIGLPGGRGTADMANRLKRAGVPLVELAEAAREDAADARPQVRPYPRAYYGDMTSMFDYAERGWCQ